MKAVNALGRRKSAVARVYVVPGKGNITINGSYLEKATLQSTAGTSMTISQRSLSATL